MTTLLTPVPTQQTQKTYSIFSIGQRGAGKTVFMAGTYAALQTNDNSYELACEDEEAKQNMTNVLNYIAKTGQYPPATIKMTNFDFLLKQKRGKKESAIGTVRWWDIPGESCQLYNPAFLTMAVNADGCTIFLDAEDLTQPEHLSENLNHPFQFVITLAELFHQNKISCPLAILLTKCDLVLNNPQRWQALKTSIQPLETHLNKLAIKYHIFYSAIPIQKIGKSATLQGNQAGEAFLWLISEIRQKEGETGLKSLNVADDFSNQRSFPVHQARISLQKSIMFLGVVLISSLLGLLSITFLQNIVNSQSTSDFIEEGK